MRDVPVCPAWLVHTSPAKAELVWTSSSETLNCAVVSTMTHCINKDCLINTTVLICVQLKQELIMNNELINSHLITYLVARYLSEQSVKKLKLSWFVVRNDSVALWWWALLKTLFTINQPLCVLTLVYADQPQH